MTISKRPAIKLSNQAKLRLAKRKFVDNMTVAHLGHYGKVFINSLASYNLETEEQFLNRGKKNLLQIKQNISDMEKLIYNKLVELRKLVHLEEARKLLPVHEKRFKILKKLDKETIDRINNAIKTINKNPKIYKAPPEVKIKDNKDKPGHIEF